MLGIYLSMLNSAEDQTTFETLYRNNKYRAMSTACGILKNEMLAQDAVHEAFLYIAEHYERLNRKYDKGLEGYLYQCVQCRAINLAQKQGREESYEAWMEVSGAERAAAPTGDVERVVYTMQRLPKKYGIVLELYSTGWDTSEIAENLKLSLRTVQRRLEKARELMREELKQYDAADE